MKYLYFLFLGSHMKRFRNKNTVKSKVDMDSIYTKTKFKHFDFVSHVIVSVLMFM